MKPLPVLLLLGLVLNPRPVAGQEATEPSVSAQGAEEPAAEPIAETPEAFLARLEQRRLDAEARTLAAGLALAGEIPIEEAFPKLARAPLDSVAWVTGRLAELNELGKAYAAERQAEISRRGTSGRSSGVAEIREGDAEEGELRESETAEEETPDGPPPEEDPLRAALGATHQALTEADEMERRFLLAVLAYLERNPQLTRPNLASDRIELTARVAAAEDAFARADKASAEQRALEVVAAQRQVERLEKLLRGLLLHFTVDAPLPGPEADIGLLDDPSEAQTAKLRLGWLLPFLSDQERTDVNEALALRRAVEAQAAEARAAVESREKSVAGRHAETQTAAGVAEKDAQDARARLGQRQQEIENERAGLWDRLEGSRNKAKEIAEQLPRDDKRRDAADALYGEIRELEGDVLRAIGKAGSKSIEADRSLAEAQAEAASAGADIQRQEEAAKADDTAPIPEVFAGWRRAVDSRVSTTEELVGLEKGYRDEISGLLREARDLRRSLAGEVSGRLSRKDLLDDLLTEATLLVPNILELAEHRWNMVLELPSKWKDWSFSATLLIHAFWILFVGVTCLVARRQVPRVIRRLLRLGTVRARRYVPRDLRSMARPAERTLKALIDLATGAVLLWLLGDALPELGLVCLIYLQVALYRFLVGLTSLAVARYPEVRPALVTLVPTAREMVLTSVRILVLWGIARQFSRYFATRILAAVTLDEALRLGFNVLLAVLVVWLLHVWEPVLRDALQRRDPRHPLVVFLTRRRLGPLSAFQVLAHALAYVGLWTRDLLSLHVLRKTASAGDDAKGARLPGEFIAQLLRRECPENGYVERPETRKELDRALRHWHTERRRGVTMLTGGQGAGKHTFVDHWCKALENEEPPVVRVRLRERLTTSDGACLWLAKALSIEDPATEPEALAGRVNERLTGQVVVLEDLHFAFLRRVDGFAALCSLLSVVGSASSRIFWLLSMHRPSWHYLDSLGGLINTEACQRVIELEPFRETELRRLVEQRIATADHEVGFSQLLPRSARHEADPLALERITAEYFRRLAWVSQGNPTVALRLWRKTLVPGRGDGRLEATRFGQPAALPALRDPDLFLLAAIYTHRSLAEDELVAVTNMGPAQVNAAVRNLEARGLLTGRSKRFAIEPRYLPAVTAELRQRHFIHGGA